MKNILIAIVSALLIICFCTSCYSDSIVASDSVSDDLPSKVDLRNYDGKNYVTSVKRQSFGDCWSFSLAGSAEIAYLYANNMGVDAGELNDYVDFSEKYIAWYMYHGMTNDDVVKGKVKDLNDLQRNNSLNYEILNECFSDDELDVVMI